jgi:hypothetical protein
MEGIQSSIETNIYICFVVVVFPLRPINFQEHSLYVCYVNIMRDRPEERGSAIWRASRAALRTLLESTDVSHYRAEVFSRHFIKKKVYTHIYIHSYLLSLFEKNMQQKPTRSKALNVCLSIHAKKITWTI